MPDLATVISDMANRIPVLTRRYSLDTPGIQTTIPMIRGVLGAALYGLDQYAYHTVFRGDLGVGKNEQTPAYILRPAPPEFQPAPSLDFILIGPGVACEAVCARAWDIASGMGLGPKRLRFHIRGIQPIIPSDTAWAPTRPCRLRFPAPLRLLYRKRLIEQPTLADLTVAAIRRLRAFLDDETGSTLKSLEPALLEVARELHATPWQGERLDLIRYSATQHAELELRGVTGSITLPSGPGPLATLLYAMQWLHLGKGTVNGMGQLLMEPLPA